MQLNEVCVYQLKPDKTEAFEAIVKAVSKFFEENEDMLYHSFTKRTHRLESMETIRAGTPPKALTKVVKSVKYVMYFETVDPVMHGEVTKVFFERFDKEMSRCLLVPGDKYIGCDLE